jgi:hypothetical protein
VFSATAAAPIMPTDPDIAPPKRCGIKVVRFMSEVRGEKGTTLGEG